MLRSSSLVFESVLKACSDKEASSVSLSKASSPVRSFVCFSVFQRHRVCHFDNSFCVCFEIWALACLIFQFFFGSRTSTSCTNVSLSLNNEICGLVVCDIISPQLVARLILKLGCLSLDGSFLVSCSLSSWDPPWFLPKTPWNSVSGRNSVVLICFCVLP